MEDFDYEVDNTNQSLQSRIEELVEDEEQFEHVCFVDHESLKALLNDVLAHLQRN